MAIGDPVTQPVPAVGAAGTNYASQIVAFLQEVKARLEAKVAISSLLAGLFDMSNNGIANARYVGLYEQLTVPSTPVGSMQRYGGELYYVSPSGAVRITNGGSLDVVSANGITGDYAAPAEFRYDLGSVEYFAYSNYGATPKQWARVGAQGFDIYGTLTGTTRVRLAWAGAANPSYTLTLPATVPASTAYLVMDTSGNVLTRTKTGKKLVIGPADYQEESANSYATAAKPYFQYNIGYYLGYSGAKIVAPVNVKPGDTITDCKLYLNKSSSATVNIFAALYKIAYSDGTRTAIDSNAATANAPGNTSIQVASGGPGTLSELVVDTHYYQLEMYTNAAGANSDYLRAAVITYNEGV